MGVKSNGPCMDISGSMQGNNARGAVKREDKKGFEGPWNLIWGNEGSDHFLDLLLADFLLVDLLPDFLLDLAFLFAGIPITNAIV
ncbi:MAG: hypothetical protein QXL32_01395 [Candidatus Bathyarchaeia archaeon]